MPGGRGGGGGLYSHQLVGQDNIILDQVMTDK